MEQEVSLEQAVAALKNQYGPTLVMGFDDGKDDMSKTLERALGIPGHEAKKVVDALVETKTIRWASSPSVIPNQQGTMGMVVEEATWHLGD